MSHKSFVRPLVLFLIVLLAVQPLAAAADPAPFAAADEIVTLPAYGPLSYQPALDCEPSRCAEFVQTAESAEGGGGGAATQTTWIWVAVIVVLVVAVSAGGGGGGGGY